MFSICLEVGSSDEYLQDMERKEIGVTGFEPATSWSQTRRSTKLSYTPGTETMVGPSGFLCHRIPGIIFC